jgi:nucleotide-binding universal stress UspA family protein
MKHILVPTDFSSGSVNALEYASKISELLNSEITVLWVDNYDTTTNLRLDIQSSVRQEAQDEIKEMLEKAKSVHPNIKYKSKIKSGKVFREVSSMATADNTSLIVISTHGGSGFEDYWIGSNAFRIISASPCPVISVKQMFKMNEKPISRILVPIDHTPDTLQKLPSIIEFATKFNAEINIVAIYATSLKTLNQKVDNSATTAQKMITEANLPFYFDSLMTDNIASDLLKFMENSAIDLIAIMTEQSGKEENTLMGPVAQQIINRSPIPVLSIR